MNNLTPTILIMISIIGLVITVPLLFYYGQNNYWLKLGSITYTDLKIVRIK